MFKTLTDLNKTIFNKVSPLQSELLHYWIFLHSYTTVFHTIKELSHSLISTPHVSTILHINYLLACNVCSEKYQWIKQTPAFDLTKGNQNYKCTHVTFYGMILSALSYMIKWFLLFKEKAEEDDDGINDYDHHHNGAGRRMWKGRQEELKYGSRG